MNDCNENQKVDLKGLHIENDDEYMDLDFYRYGGKSSNYNYTKRKYESNYGKSATYISLYRDNYSEKLGYYYLACRLSVKPIYIHPGYTRYSELIEFGFANNNIDEIKYLLDDMLKLAAEFGSLFIKVKTKEKSFEKFYELLRTYKHTEDNKHIYLEITSNNNPKHEHLKHYEDDKLSIREIYHLYAMRFKVLKDKCIYQLPDNEFFIVDRKTREVTYPERIINKSDKYDKLNQDSINLMHLIIMNAYDYRNKIIDVNYQIEGYDYQFVKIGNHLFAYKDFKYENGYNIKKRFNEFCIKAYKEHGCMVLHICTPSNLQINKLYASYSKEWNFLPDYAGEGPELSSITKLRLKWHKEELKKENKE